VVKRLSVPVQTKWSIRPELKFLFFSRLKSRHLPSFFSPLGLVLTGNDEAALECFESLIHLAKEQLNHVFAEKSELPPLSPEERTEMFTRVCSLNFDFLV